MTATQLLAIGVTAVAFILWYSCVAALGAGRAGLLTGIAPVAAAMIGRGCRPPRESGGNHTRLGPATASTETSSFGRGRNGPVLPWVA